MRCFRTMSAAAARRHVVSASRSTAVFDGGAVEINEFGHDVRMLAPRLGRELVQGRPTSVAYVVVQGDAELQVFNVGRRRPIRERLKAGSIAVVDANVVHRLRWLSGEGLAYAIGGDAAPRTRSPQHAALPAFVTSRSCPVSQPMPARALVTADPDDAASSLRGRSAA